MDFNRLKRIFACVALVVMLTVVLAPAVFAEEQIDLTDYEQAAEYVKNFEENKKNDPDFYENIDIAHKTISNSMEQFDDAVEYLDGYGDNSLSDPDFESNSKTAIETVKNEIPLFSTFWALVPPVIAIVLALITKEVYSSLFVGIVAGGLLASNFNMASTVDYVVDNGIISAVSDTAGIFAFLVMLGALVSLVNKAGGSAAFGRWAQKHIHSKTGAAFATFILGILIFIDDYFNCLTVGSVMRPVADSHKISRSKLAFIIDATAAPVCMIAPISSWAAAVASYAEEGKGIELFIKAIPYNFYSLLMFVFIIGMIMMKFDFGPMKLHEKNAENGDLFTSGEIRNDADEETNDKGIVFDLVFPIAALIVACVLALVYNGNGNSFVGINFIEAFSNTDATVGLPWGGLIALIVSIIYFTLRRVISFKSCMGSISEGFKAMVPAILILTMATALKNMTTIMGAKVFVAQLMEGAAGSLSAFLPAIIFLVACGLAFATGTSWGTFGILIPIVTAIFTTDSTLMIIGMSACLAGAVCGDHCSPISDTTIMSSAGAQCDHVNHVSTQLPYALLVAAVSFVCYIIAPFVRSAWLALPIAIALMVCVLVLMKFLSREKEQN